MYTMDFIKLIFCVMLPVSSFAAGVYLIASFLYEEYNGRKKEKPPENRTEQPRERRQINCENCKAKDWCTLRACLVSRSMQIARQILCISRQFFAEILYVFQEKLTKKYAKYASKMRAERY